MASSLLTTRLCIPPVRPDPSASSPPRAPPRVLAVVLAVAGQVPSTGPSTEFAPNEADGLMAGLRTRLVPRPRLIER